VRATSTPLRADDKRFVLRFLHVARMLRAKDLRRWQAVVRRAYPHLLALRGPWCGTIDDEYCAAWRSAMLAAGGTERDIDVLAVYMVLLAIAETERGSSDRQDLIERIAEHVAGTSMVVRIGRGDDYVALCELRIRQSARETDRGEFEARDRRGAIRQGAREAVAHWPKGRSFRSWVIAVERLDVAEAQFARNTSICGGFTGAPWTSAVTAICSGLPRSRFSTSIAARTSPCLAAAKSASSVESSSASNRRWTRSRAAVKSAWRAARIAARLAGW